MSVSVTLKSYFYEVLIPSSQKNTSSPIEDILHHVSISFMKKLALYKCFNPRTHTGCDPLRSFTCKAASGFNPRTHTGCDFSLMIFSASICVSIHAPTRGATGFTAHKLGLGSVSIHAPTRGATGKVTSCGILYSVSIHAPTRGATWSTVPLLAISEVSIHAPTRGATLRQPMSLPLYA